MSKHSKPEPVPRALPLTTVRRRLFELANHVVSTGQPITLTEHGQPKVVLVSVSRFERLLELEKTAAPRSASRTDLESRYERLAKSLAGAGFILSEKSARPYGAAPGITKSTPKP